MSKKNAILKLSKVLALIVTNFSVVNERNISCVNLSVCDGSKKNQEQDTPCKRNGDLSFLSFVSLGQIYP